MKIDSEKLLELEEEYEIGFTELMNYYIALKDIPCVQKGDENSLLDCLHLLIQDRISNEFNQEEMKKRGDNQENLDYENKPLEYSVSDALYRIYEDEAIPYLTEQYKEEHDLQENMAL